MAATTRQGRQARLPKPRQRPLPGMVRRPVDYQPPRKREAMRTWPSPIFPWVAP